MLGVLMFVPAIVLLAATNFVYGIFGHDVDFNGFRGYVVLIGASCVWVIPSCLLGSLLAIGARRLTNKGAVDQSG